MGGHGRNSGFEVHVPCRRELLLLLISAAQAVYQEYVNIPKIRVFSSGIGGTFLINIWHPGGPGGI